MEIRLQVNANLSSVSVHQKFQGDTSWNNYANAVLTNDIRVFLIKETTDANGCFQNPYRGYIPIACWSSVYLINGNSDYIKVFKVIDEHLVITKNEVVEMSIVAINYQPFLYK